MKRLNWLFTLSSLSVILVTIERFSFTTKILLQPYNFLRLHEVVQIAVIISLTVIIPFLILRDVTENFKGVGSGKRFKLFLLFLIGVYFYATGNGVHETASFLFNNYCDIAKFSGNLCNGLFINDYYTGNILYFLGAGFMVIPTLLFEKVKPRIKFNNKDTWILIVNALIYSLAIFAYAAFDRVLVGLVYALVMTIISTAIFLPLRKFYRKYPVITYTTVTYLIGTLLAIVVRFR